MASAQNCGCPAGAAAPPVAGPSLAPTCGAALLTFMSLLDTVIRQQCFLDDPCGRVPPLDRDPEGPFDFVVVGGGSAGAVVAARLSEVSNWRVLLLEAGDDEPPGAQVPSMVINYHGTSIDWNYRTQPEPHVCQGMPEKRCVWVRGKVLGGSSTINGMVYVRGHPHDYDSWASQGNEGWSFNDVLPYFKKSEDNLQVDQLGTQFHGVGGPLPVTHFPHRPALAEAVLRAGEELGLQRNTDLNGARFTGISIAQTTSRDGVRVSSARAFLRPARSRTNLHVLLNTTAIRIVIDNKTMQACAVEYMQNGVRKSVNVSKEVVVSAGVINSPQLLLLSGIGPREDLDNVGIPVLRDLPGVGRNLNNHVAFPVVFNIRNTTDTYELDWLALLEYMLHHKGPMSSTGLSQVTAKFNTKYADPSGDDPDLQMFFHSSVPNCAKTGTVGEHKDPSVQQVRQVYFVPVVLHPRSRGFIKLNSSNPLDDPLIYANYLADPRDVDTLVEGLKLAVRLGETDVLKTEYGFTVDRTPVEGCENYIFGSDDYWKCAVQHISGLEVNHQAGSCKMGPQGDSMAVVDPELRVHGLRNVRVADASVIPGNVSGNTNAPVIMIAEKVSDLIKNEWFFKNDGLLHNAVKTPEANKPPKIRSSTMPTWNPYIGFVHTQPENFGHSVNGQYVFWLQPSYTQSHAQQPVLST